MKDESEELSSNEIFMSVDAFRESLANRIVDQYLRYQYPERYAPSDNQVE